MTDFKVGDYVKIDQRVFKVSSISKGLSHIPDGFLNDGADEYRWVNPKFCEPYKGATSVINSV